MCIRRKTGTHHARIQIIMSFVHPVNVPVAQATMDTVTIFNIIKWKTKNITLSKLLIFCVLEAVMVFVLGV
jgi:hypothetical protein